MMQTKFRCEPYWSRTMPYYKLGDTFPQADAEALSLSNWFAQDDAADLLLDALGRF